MPTRAELRRALKILREIQQCVSPGQGAPPEQLDMLIEEAMQLVRSGQASGLDLRDWLTLLSLIAALIELLRSVTG